MRAAGDASARAADYEGKITVRLLVGVVVAATGGMLFGYDLGVTGKQQDHIVSLAWGACWSVVVSVSSLLQVLQELFCELLYTQTAAQLRPNSDKQPCAAGGVSSFPSFISKFFPEVEGRSGSNAYCTYNSQKLQMFTSSYFLAGEFAHCSFTVLLSSQ